jgi:hypothetical protein
MSTPEDTSAIFVPNGGDCATRFDPSPEQQAALFRGGARAAGFITGHAAAWCLPGDR